MLRLTMFRYPHRCGLRPVGEVIAEIFDLAGADSALLKPNSDLKDESDPKGVVDSVQTCTKYPVHEREAGR